MTGPDPDPSAEGAPGRRERAFNAPGPVLVVAGAVLLAYLVQSRLGSPNPMVRALALTPVDLQDGRPWTLLTVTLVHGSWLHAGLNALGALAFGTPVARWFEGRGRPGRFWLLYLAAACLSSLGFVLLHWGGAFRLVGASGAISGLMGASARLLDDRRRLAPFTSRTVLGMTGAWILINGLFAFNWIDAGQGGAPVAWEAHLFGYAAGLLLIGPLSRTGVEKLSADAANTQTRS